MTSDSRRRQVEKTAAKLRRGWLTRRGLKASMLPPDTADALVRWSEAEARLQLADEGPFDRWLVAAMNTAGRRARELEALAAAAGPSAEDEMRALLGPSAEDEMRALLSKPPAVVDEASESDGDLVDDDALRAHDVDDAGTLAEIEAEDTPSPAPSPLRRRHAPAHPDPTAWLSEKSRNRNGGLPSEF